MLPTNAKASRSKLSEKIDNRLFIRLPLNHDWRKLSPTGLRNAIIEWMLVSTTTIRLIKPARSGFAVSPGSAQAREDLLKASGGLFLSGATLEPDTNWVGLLVPTVPRVIYTLKERFEVTGALLADEIERVSSIRPAAIKPYGIKIMKGVSTSMAVLHLDKIPFHMESPEKSRILGSIVYRASFFP